MLIFGHRYKNMHICGLNKMTLLDYPGKVAATIFLGGCNFRCPYCQNSGLVLHPSTQHHLSLPEITAFLQKRRSLLDGICISGGEPTMDPDLPKLLEHIRSYGYDIKLDTNGSHPEVIKSLYTDGLIQCVAMDIKSSQETYAKAAGSPRLSLKPIMQSVDFLLTSGIDYEFRTTVVRQLHEEKDFRSIGQWLAGAKAYYLQAYKDSPQVLQPGFDSFTRNELEHFRSILSETIPLVGIRGLD